MVLVFIIKDGKVLLGLKKRGFGEGNWNGFGGKPNPDESDLEAAKREVLEESGLQVNDLIEMANLKFHFEKDPDIERQVKVYLANDYIGEPKESEEMKPEWFDAASDFVNNIKIWKADRIWLPYVLRGEKIEAIFTYGDTSGKAHADEDALEYKINVIKRE